MNVVDTVATWCRSRGVDAAVWTALPAQFEKQTGRSFSVDTAVLYLKGLPQSARTNALDYVRKAPEETETPVRARLRREGLV